MEIALLSMVQRGYRTIGRVYAHSGTPVEKMSAARCFKGERAANPSREMDLLLHCTPTGGLTRSLGFVLFRFTATSSQAGPIWHMLSDQRTSPCCRVPAQFPADGCILRPVLRDKLNRS